MKSKIFEVALTAILLLTANTIFAQTYAESALLFSRTTPGGSARIQGLGGAQTALGGDYSSGLSNPAGLGMFNRSEFTFSPGFNSFNTSAKYLGNSDTEVNTRLTIPGLSVVFNLPKRNNGDFVGGSFGISMTRINNFNQTFQYHGTTDKSNPSSSIIDSFIDLANGDTPAQFDEGDYNYNTPTGLAYYNYLIGPQRLQDPSYPNDAYFSDVQTTSFPNQRENVLNSGSSNQYTFSYGGNYKDRLFFGGGIGITSLRYKTSKIYSEAFSTDPALSSLQLNENLSIRGSGVNLTMGVIGRPVNFLQIGASFTTPTIYSLSESYDASMKTSWNNFVYYDGNKNVTLKNESANTDVVTSNYTLVTPLKLTGGIAFISKYGFLTGDLELMNFSSARYSSNTEGVSYSEDNSEIKSNYRTVLNYRIGAEFRHSIFRARAGYGVQANTYATNYDADNTIQTVSGGLGVRTKKFSIDFALLNSVSDGIYSPYQGAPTVNLSNNLTSFILTFGFSF